MEVVAVFLPLIGAILAGLFARQLGDRGAQIATIAPMQLSALLAVIVFFDVAVAGNARTVELFTWIDSGSFELSWALRMDTLSAVMLAVVTIVSAMVHVYSVGYMEHDPSKPRFFAYLSLFTFFMLMLATADNFVQLFFGWEGVGLASYLLIGFWYEAPVGQRRGDQGVPGQPGRRRRLRAGHRRGVLPVRCGEFDGSSPRPRTSPRRHELPRHARCTRSTWSASCCSSAPWGNRPSSACTPGCRTPWRARPRSPR